MKNLDTLESVFGSRVFRVPDYQREYSWEESHREDLLRDLEGVGQIPSHKNHFMGMLVLHARADEEGVEMIPGKEFEVVDVVDGQQRLTTLAILLKCIADELRKLEHPQASYPARDIRESFLAVQSGESSVVRLRLQGKQRKYFEKYILRDEPHPKPRTPGDANLRDAEHEFREYLASQHESADSDEEWLEDLLELKQAISQRLTFVVYDVADEAEVGVMFEVMNARGKSLTQLEKVKNYLLYLVSKIADQPRISQLSDRINDAWKYVLRTTQRIHRADEDQLLLYDWVINPDAPEGENPNKVTDVHRAVKRWVNLREMNDRALVESRVQAYVDRLERSCDSYRDLIAPREVDAFEGVPGDSSDLVNSVEALDRIGRPATVLPLLMVIYQQFEDDPDVCRELFRLLEVYSFRTAAMEFYANKGRSRIYRYARELAKDGDESAGEVKRWIVNLIEDVCPTRRFEAQMKAPDRNFYDWNQLQFFLYEYERERSRQSGQEVPIDWERLSSQKRKRETIEHILPQGEDTPKLQYWNEHFSEEEWRANVNRLGNLCITNWNSSYYNRPYPQKCAPEDGEKGYENSRWIQERELARNWDDWTPGAIEERHERLVEFALERWTV